MSKRNRRKYSDREKGAYLLALEANHNNVLKTSRETGIPRTTLMEWAAGCVNGDVHALRQSQRGDFIEKLEELAQQLADALPGKVEDASLQQTATSMAICVDKARLLAEKSTANINYQEIESQIEYELRRIAGVAEPEEITDLERIN